MTDFVTRLESELRQAALRRERSGAVRGTALPRLRVALRDVPAAAVATVLLGLAVVGVAIMLASSPERPAQGALPAELAGTWRAPPTELRLYAAGSKRCTNLGLSSSRACYTIGDAATRVAYEWGTLTVAGDELTLHATQNSTAGVYRWRLEQGKLRVTKLHDRLSSRARALVTTPLAIAPRPDSRANLPAEWTAQVFTSKRFGYSIRFPHTWLAEPGGAADRFSRNPARSVLPSVSVVAHDLAPGTSAARWGVIVDSQSEAAGCAPHDFRRFFVGGVKIRVSVYPACGGTMRQSASFVHGGRGYRVVWSGSAQRPEDDYPRFDALLETIAFPP